MILNPATGATVVQVVSSTIATLKNARDLAKDSKDNELKGVIGDAFDSLLDLKERILALDEENRELKAQLATKAFFTNPVSPFGYIIREGGRRAESSDMSSLLSGKGPRVYAQSPALGRGNKT